MDNGFELDVFSIIVIFIGVVAVINALIIRPLEESWANRHLIPGQIIETIQTSWFKALVIVLVFILFITLNILIQKHLLKKSIKKQEKEARLKEEAKLVSNFLKTDLDDCDSDELKKFIEREDDLEISGETEKKFDIQIRNKLNKAKKLIPKKLRDEEIQEYRDDKESLQREIQELANKKYQDELKQENKEKAILRKLNIDENLIYELEDLRPEEIEVLENEGFNKISEYDPIEEKNLTFFVKQISNHSATHTFLVERIRQLLEQRLDSDDINIHDTKDADITFTIGSVIHAFEIETGNLLTKKKQLKEKINFLNNKYGINWYFVVSNRDLAKKYKKFGRVTSRRGVCKIIEKLADF